MRSTTSALATLQRYFLLLITGFLLTLITLTTQIARAAVHHAGATLGEFSVGGGGSALYTISLELPQRRPTMMGHRKARFRFMFRSGRA